MTRSNWYEIWSREGEDGCRMYHLFSEDNHVTDGLLSVGWEMRCQFWAPSEEAAGYKFVDWQKWLKEERLRMIEAFSIDELHALVNGCLDFAKLVRG